MDVQSYRIILDAPAKRPALGFNEYARALQQIIEHSKPQFAIGIFGGWGSGKTTLMHTLERSLDSSQIIVVHFSAWRYEKEEHLVIPLLDVIRERLIQWSEERTGLKEKALETAATIGKVIHSLLAGISMKIGVPDALEISLDANKSLAQADQWDQAEREARTPRSFHHASFQALNEAFRSFIGEGKHEKRIVIFVDDLDRCLPQGALEVLESMKLFFDLEGFIFVVGLDREVVEWCIDSKYRQQGSSDEERESRRIRGADYIKKIFQVPFSLAPVATNQLDEFLRSMYLDADLPQKQIEELRDVVAPHLRYMVTEAGVNPREVKRFINGYTLLRKIKPALKPGAVLALQTISFRPDWDAARKALLLYRAVFTVTVSRRLNGERDALRDLDPRLAGVPESFLQYVAADGPGHELLKVHDLDAYLYAGEATRSSRSTYWLDLIQKAADLRGGLRDAGEVLRRGEKLPENAESEIYGLLSILESSDGASRGGPLLKAQLNELKENLASRPQVPLHIDPWSTENERIISQVIGSLMAFYEAGDVGARESAGR